MKSTRRSLRGQLKLDQASFGTVFSDHMLVARYQGGEWQDFVIEGYGPLPMPPSINAIQYGLAVFEGLKAYRTVRGDVALFRPRDNFLRLGRSCRRLALPEVPERTFLEGLRKLVRLDRDWVPGPDEGSLYIRPCLFATDETIRVKSPASCTFVIFTCPVGTYYAEPLRLFATTQYARAFPGGTGDVKPAGNYAPSLLAEKDAQARGYHSVLWLDARERRYVEEAGVMNVFFVIDGIAVTPHLAGTILPGITRDCVITLLKRMDVPVEERAIDIAEVLEAHRSGRLQECFGTGTAATIAHISKIGSEGWELVLPAVEKRTIGSALLHTLQQLQTGRIDDPYGWLVTV